MLRCCCLGLLLLAVSLTTAAAQSAQPAQEKPPPKASTGKPKVRPDQVPGYKARVIEGFTVILAEEALENHEASKDERKPLDVLELELKAIVRLMPTKALNVLRNVLIWVEWDERKRLSNGREGTAVAVYYGGHQLSLLQSGKHPLKAKNVTILSLKGLTAEHQPKRDAGRCVILHEIAHAVHDQLLGDDNPTVLAAYKQALERKLYDPGLYVATNEMEFFAELTCAYFDQLDHFPRTRVDLKKHDPVSSRMLEGVWGKPKVDVAARGKAAAGAISPWVSAAPDLKLDKVELGRTVSGPKVTLDELKDRPVLLLLWNADSPASLACFQKVAPLHDELDDFGLATVALHLTGPGQRHDLGGLARARDFAFSVTEAPWVEGGLVDEPTEFPVCLVFDHKGQCQFRGSPLDAETAARAAVGQMLLTTSGVETFPMNLSLYVEALKKGRPLGLVMSKLAPLTRSPDKETAAAAKALLDRLTEAGRKALKQAEDQLKEDPVAAYLLLEPLSATYKDTPLAARADSLLGKLKPNKDVALELKSRAGLIAIRKVDKELSGRPGSFSPLAPGFRQENATQFKQLRDYLQQMKKSWPRAKATEEAGRIADKYGIVVN